MRAQRRHGSRPARCLLVGLAASALLVASCSSSDGDGDEGSDTTASERSSTTSTTTTEPVITVPVDQTAPGGANGIKVAGDGSLWIASLDSDVVLRVDPDSGQILQRVATPVGSGPDDLVIAPDGSVHWTGWLSGAVGSIAPGGDTTEVIANVGAGANPIALRGDGVLVVGRAGGATGLYTVDPTGDSTPVPLSDPGNLNSFDITPDGRFFAPGLNTSTVIELDPDTGEVLRTVASVEGSPIALRWHDGSIYVLVLSDAARVFRVDPAAGTTELFGATGHTAGDNLAVAEDGTVYVTGLAEPIVTVLDPDGAVVRTVQLGG